MGDWQDTRDPMLTSTQAPHETAGVLRMHRAGWPVTRIMQRLRLSEQQLIHEMKSALDDETEAARQGLKVHDAKIEKEEW